MERFTIGISPDFDTPARGPLVAPSTFDAGDLAAKVRFLLLKEWTTGRGLEPSEASSTTS